MKVFKWNIELNRRPSPLSLERVIEMSQAETDSLRDQIAELRKDQNQLAKLVEATRRKVYRDGEVEDLGPNGDKDKVTPGPGPGYRTGDPL